MNRQMEKAIEALEDELARDDLTESERKQLRKELRELMQEAKDEERWQEEGRERGWRS